MNVPFLNLAAQHDSIKAEVLPIVEQVLAHGHYILGPNLAAFEQELSSFLGSRFGIGVNSGSDALTLALKALEIGPGDEVITSPFTYIAPAEAIYQTGATLVFADIDPKTFCLDPQAVAQRITPKTRAIIPIHLFGQPSPMDELFEVIREKPIHLVEDCAQSIGSTYKGCMTGSMGVMGCFSFYPTKNLGANGDGGMVVTSDEPLARRLKMLRVHGIERRYFHDFHGFNSRLDELQAAILRVKLKRLETWNNRRRAIAALYTQGLHGLPLQLPVTREGCSHVFHVYALLSKQRNDLQKHLADHGVPTLIYYPQPLHLQKVYEDHGWRAGDFPQAEIISTEILPLPMYPELTDQQVAHVIAAIRSFNFQLQAM